MTLDKLLDTTHSANTYHPLLKSIETTSSYELVLALSLHADPNLPWCSLENANLVKSIMSNFDYQPYIPQLIRHFKSSLKRIQRTALNKHILLGEENLGVISQAWFLVDYAYTQEICILAMLLVVDVLTTYSVPGKIQGFKLLSHLPELHHPLLPQVRSAASKCLVHVPPITPIAHSLPLLEEAYHWVYKLNQTTPDYIQTIATILSTINTPARPFLLQQLSKYTRRVSTDVFISTSKIFYALNNILVSLDITPEEVALALTIQNDIINLNHKFVLTYAYDFIGAWSILLRRHPGKFADQLKRNISSLQKLANNNDIDTLCTYIAI